MPNTVSLGKDGIIYDFLEGDQSIQNVQSNLDSVKGMVTQAQKQGQKILILVDLEKVGKHSSEARKAALSWVIDIPFDRLAVYGTTQYLKYVVSFVMLAAGKADKVAYFSDRQRAKDWLNGRK